MTGTRRNLPMPAQQMRQRQPADLEHLPAQWLSAHGNTEGAMWVYDAAAELARLRAALTETVQEQDRLEDRIGETRDGVMVAIEEAGLHPHVCEDDDLPDMVRQALTAAKHARDAQTMAAVREALRLLDDWQTAEELGTVEEWAVQIAETLEPLTGGHP